MGLATHSYDGVAFFYDELASAYSLGRIEASKQAQIGSLGPGDRVLFAGVGRGREAIAAARRGATVTAVDLSPRMLGRLQRGVRRAGVAVEAIQGDVAKHRPQDLYDTVFAHYFLNLFDASDAATMLRVLTRFVRPGGRLILADFAPPTVGRGGGWLTEAYYRPVNWIAWALGYCALHPILDYPRLMEGLGLQLRMVTRFPIFPGLADPAYHSLVVERVESLSQ